MMGTARFNERTKMSEETDQAQHDAESFFLGRGGYQVVLKLWGMTEEVSVEDLYQHFKARMLDEMREEKVSQ
jgi:hypothetical protein